MLCLRQSLPGIGPRVRVARVRNNLSSHRDENDSAACRCIDNGFVMPSCCNNVEIFGKDSGDGSTSDDADDPGLTNRAVSVMENGQPFGGPQLRE